MRSTVLTAVLISVVALSMVSTPQAQTANFSLKLIFPSDTLYYDSIAQTMAQQLAPLFVQVESDGLPRPVYLNSLSTHDYDLAVFSLEQVNKQYPSLWSQFSPDSYIGRDIYQTGKASVLSGAGIDNPQILYNLLNQYLNASTEAEKINLAHAIQQQYVSNWALDIPLISTATISATWSQFKPFDHQEGLINSLFLGAKWASNPSERNNRDRTTSDFHTAILGFERLRNPMYYISRAGYQADEALFSTAFLTDKNGGIHPNLAISYNKTVYDNGSSSWLLNLRQDASWSDGQPLTARDLQFSYDLATFDWMGTTNQNEWNTVTSVKTIDNYTIQIDFSNNALTNKYTIANQFVVPEHILNQTVVVDGQSHHPYDGYDPSDTPLWQNFEIDPTTAGPFNYDTANSKTGEIATLQRNTNYWSPSIDDTPNHIFDLVSNTTQDPYYFDGINQVQVDTLVYHISGSQNIDPNTLLTSFTTGSRDMVEFKNLDPNAQIADDSRFSVQAIGNSGGGLVVLFNPSSPNIDNLQIRKAINQAVNREEISSLIGLGQLPQLTPVSKYYNSYYDTSAQIKESYTDARDIFRQQGYDALDDTTVQQTFEWPWSRVLPVPIMPILMAIASLAVIIRQRQQVR